MKYVVIDRFEGNFAICIDDDEKVFEIEIKRLPVGSKEGDVLKKLKGDRYEFDEKETKKRREEMYDLQNKLFTEDE